MSVTYFIIPFLSFIPFYAFSLILFLVLRRKLLTITDQDEILAYKKIYIVIPIVLLVLAIIYAFLTDLGYSIYGGSFDASVPLLIWIVIKINLYSDILTVSILLIIYWYLSKAQSLKADLKINILNISGLVLTVIVFMASFTYPTSTAETEAYFNLLMVVLSQFLAYVQILIIGLAIYFLVGDNFEELIVEFLRESNPHSSPEQITDIYLAIKLAIAVVGSIAGFFTLSILFGMFDSGLAVIIGQGYQFIPLVLIFTLAVVIIGLFIRLRRMQVVKKFRPLAGIFIITAIVISPVTMLGGATVEINKSEDALFNVNFATDPLKEYPVNLDDIRLVDRALAQDIADNLKLPEPPKSFRVDVLDQYEEIGVINGSPSWIVPMRYHQVFGNPETNYIAGYIGVNLSSPIPEDAKVKYVEMTIGPGLDGYRNIEWLVREHFPNYMMGNIYLVDPWKETGKPAWAVILDKLSPWGVRESVSLLMVKADGSYEVLTRDEAIAEGLFMINSDYTIMSEINFATEYLRGSHVDPSAKGYLLLPSSPDVQEPIGTGKPDRRSGNDFYYDAHHFLMPNNIVGRDRYMIVKTGSKESIVAWTAVNTSLTYYDFRSYSKGGISGVNSPDAVFSDISQISYESGLSSLAVRYPKLYKIDNLVGNNTLLVWVSIVVQQQSGADRFAGLAFVDAANPRFSKFLTAQLGEKPATYVSRFKEAINQTYAGFIGANDTIGGQTSTIALDNVSVLRNDWVLFQPDNTYARILYIQSGNSEIYFIVTENSVGAKVDFYTALLVKPGDRVDIKARYDSSYQGWLVTELKIVS